MVSGLPFLMTLMNRWHLRTQRLRPNFLGVLTASTTGMAWMAATMVPFRAGKVFMSMFWILASAPPILTSRAGAVTHVLCRPWKFWVWASSFATALTPLALLTGKGTALTLLEPLVAPALVWPREHPSML